MNYSCFTSHAEIGSSSSFHHSVRLEPGDLSQTQTEDYALFHAVIMPLKWDLSLHLAAEISTRFHKLSLQI